MSGHIPVALNAWVPADLSLWYGAVGTRQAARQLDVFRLVTYHLVHSPLDLETLLPSTPRGATGGTQLLFSSK